MNGAWVFSDGTGPVSPAAVPEELRRRIARGRLETWLDGPAGRSLALVTNTERAMVMLIDAEGDASAHALDPGAAGRSTGFVLSNGQVDEYPNEDTVPVEEALRIIPRILATGSPPADAAWAADH